MLNRLVEGMRDAGAEVEVVNLREGKKGVVPISSFLYKVDHPLLD